jgi:hypothetical protein
LGVHRGVGEGSRVWGWIVETAGFNATESVKIDPNIPVKITLSQTRYTETGRGLLPWRTGLPFNQIGPILLFHWFDAAHG